VPGGVFSFAEEEEEGILSEDEGNGDRVDEGEGDGSIDLRTLLRCVSFVLSPSFS